MNKKDSRVNVPLPVLSYYLGIYPEEPKTPRKTSPRITALPAEV
jgi:hypothetical protein